LSERIEKNLCQVINKYSSERIEKIYARRLTNIRQNESSLFPRKQSAAADPDPAPADHESGLIAIFLGYRSSIKHTELQNASPRLAFCNLVVSVYITVIR
jgi:hypothetical protein